MVLTKESSSVGFKQKHHIQVYSHLLQETPIFIINLKIKNISSNDKSNVTMEI